MKCFKYKSGKTTQGIEVAGKTLKTCELLVKLPKDWNNDVFINRARSREYADIFLHACVELCEGDSVGSVFPEGCFVLEMPCPISYHNYETSAMELDVTCDRVLVALYDDSCVYDKDTDKYITNDKGKPKVSDEPPTAKPQILDPGTEYYVF